MMKKILMRQLPFIRASTARTFSVSSVNYKEHIGFVGLGHMGNHMARNLLKSGYQVTVFDVVDGAVNILKQDGAVVASSPADVASKTNRICTMLPSSPQVEEVYTSADGIFSRCQPGSLYIDSSTIDPSMSQKMAEIAQTKSVSYIDAPVSGGVPAARDAGLTFMVGGSEADYNAAKDILINMGKNVVHCGAVGNGQAAKICNNMLLAISMIGVSEAMNLGIRLGLDKHVLAGIFNTSTGRCWSADTYNPCPGVIPTVPSSNDYKGGFGTALMTKDLGLAQNAATSVKAATPLGSSAHQLFRVMTNHGYGGKDFSSIYKFLQEME